MSKYKIFGSTTQELKLPQDKPQYNLDLINSQTIPPEYTFTRNSAGTYVGADGYIKTAAANEPRFDYDPITGEFKGLLVEEGRTNLEPNSNYPAFLSSTEGFGDLMGLTTELIQTPFGIRNVATITVGASFNQNPRRLIRMPATDGNPGNYTYSCFLKTKSSVSVVFFGRMNGTSATAVNLSNGNITFTQGFNNKVINYGNGWYRVTTSGFSNSPSVYGINYGFECQTLNASFYAFGFQIEKGNFETSYIPTSGSAVTRQPDQLVLNRPFNSLGTFFVESNKTRGTTVSADNGTSGILMSSTGKEALYYNTNRTLRMSSDYSPALFNIPAPQNLNRVSLGHNALTNSSYINGHLKKFMYYNSPVTEDNLRSLTGNTLDTFRYNNDIVTDGLVLNLDAAYYTGGTTWTDLSGNGNNGTLVNGVGYNSANGGSLSFDGVDDYVDAGNSSSVNIANQITISSWIYFLSSPSASGNPSIVDKWDWPNNLRSFVLGTESGNIATYVSYDGSFSNRIVCYDTSPSLNVWINLVMTYDNQTLSLYKNSSFITSSSYDQVRSIYSNQSTNIFLMRSRGTEGSIRFLNAKLSQVSIYNRALTAEEVLQNYNATKDRFI